MHTPSSLAQVGLPDTAIVLQVLHNVVTGITLAEVQPLRASPLHRLYWRARGGGAYKLLGAPSSEESFEQATMCDAPTVFFRIVRWQQMGGRMGGHPRGLWKAHLGPSPVVTELDVDGVMPSGAYISRLMRASDDGSRLSVIIVFPKGSPGRYSLCTLDLTQRQLVEHDVLTGILF